MIIAIDHGNKNIKLKNKTFTSGLISSSNPFPIGGDTLYYNGIYYMLTDERIPYMRDKTVDERFFILTLFGIAYELEETESFLPGCSIPIDLAIGLPPGHYGKQYKTFEAYFLRNPNISFEFNKKKINVSINSAVSFPQCFAAVIPYKNIVNSYSRTAVIDIGGFSLDYLQIKNGRADMSVCDSLELGIITLYNDIKSYINSNEDILIDESDIDSVIKNEPTVFNNKIKTIIEDKSRSFVNKVIDSLRERQIDLKTTHAVFVGGGSVLLEKYIRHSNKIISPDIIQNINANVVGYEQLLRKQLQNRK